MITKDMKIVDILNKDINCQEIFYEFNMFCIMCPASVNETLEEACMVHGIDPDILVGELNNFFGHLGA
jgi:hybrid cluster-associated redox disulfide protein